MLEQKRIETIDLNKQTFSPQHLMADRDVEKEKLIRSNKFYDMLMAEWKNKDKEEKQEFISKFLESVTVEKDKKEKYELVNMKLRKTFIEQIYKLMQNGMFDMTIADEKDKEVRKMERYSNEIRLIVIAKLKKTEDVKSYIEQTEKDIEDVTNLRQKYRNKLRNCKLIDEYKEKRNECTTTLNKYRKNIKTANYILEDTPRVKEVIKIEMQMKNGQEYITKTKKKDRYAR